MNTSRKYNRLIDILVYTHSLFSSRCASGRKRIILEDAYSVFCCRLTRVTSLSLARNQVGIGLSYRPASLCSLATQFQTWFLESIPRLIVGLTFPTQGAHPLTLPLGAERDGSPSFERVKYPPPPHEIYANDIAKPYQLNIKQRP